MAARFILSLDCEGKWGVADSLGAFERRSLTDERLRRSYRDIIALLDEHELPATFAFVGAFSQSPSAFRRLRPHIDALADPAPDYLRPALRDIDQGGEGWHGDWAVDTVGDARTSHEIAFHGVSHVPWTSVHREFVAAELSLLAELEGPVRDSRTMVHPRNLVAHADLLPGAGIIGFRQAPPARSRLVSLLSEFDLLSRPQADPPMAEPIAIPSGYFVNWRHGPRRLVPVALSRARARRMLDEAARSGAVVHYWLHPENIASAPGTLDLLRGILLEVRKQREAGRCEVLTQLQYCRSRSAA